MSSVSDYAVNVKKQKNKIYFVPILMKCAVHAYEYQMNYKYTPKPCSSAGFWSWYIPFRDT